MNKFARNWSCPHCGHFQTATDRDFANGHIDFHMTETAWGNIRVEGAAACCANPQCRLPMVHIDIGEAEGTPNGRRFKLAKELFVSRRMIPESSAKPQPEYIPASLRDDYLEACKAWLEIFAE